MMTNNNITNDMANDKLTSINCTMYFNFNDSLVVLFYKA